jgi:hypothetical protein
MIDELVGAPSYLVAGAPPRYPANAGFTRWVDAIGHYRPNLVMYIDGNFEAITPLSVTTIDLSNIKHWTGPGSNERAHSDTFRVDLYCGLSVWIKKADLPGFEELVFVRLINGRDLESSAFGLRHGLTVENLKTASRRADIMPEHKLTTLAIKTAAAVYKESVELRFYRFPAPWLQEPISKELRSLLSQRSQYPAQVMTFAQGKTDSAIILEALQRIQDATPSPEIEWCIQQYSHLSEEERKMVMEIVKNDLQDVGAMPQAVLPLCQTPELKVNKPAEITFEFDFEGLPYLGKGHVVGEVETLPPLHRPFLINGSSRLNEVISYAFEKHDDIVIKLVTTSMDLPTSCISTPTKSRRPEHGFGLRGNLWNERLTAHINYHGPIFFGSSPWVTCINSQVIAESVAFQKPLLIKFLPRFQSFMEWTESIPTYIDSPTFDSEGKLYSGVLPLTEDLEAVSGPWNCLPHGIRYLMVYEPGRVAFINWQEFLFKGSIPKFYIFDADYGERRLYIPSVGDDLYAKSDSKANSWILNIRTGNRTKVAKFEVVKDDPDLFVPREVKVTSPRSESGKSQRSVRQPKTQKASQADSSTSSNDAGDIKQVKVPDSVSEYKPGTWLCKRFLRLPVKYRMYLASRVWDVHERTGRYRKYPISNVWVDTLLNYVQHPGGGKRLSGRNFYVFDRQDIPIPSWFKEGEENSSRTPELTQELLDRMDGPSFGAYFQLRSYPGKPSIFSDQLSS